MGQTKKAMSKEERKYNGHPSWQFWNVSLWIGNDYELYQRAYRLCRSHGRGKAAEMLYEEIGGTFTPDGARYTKTAIRHGLRYL